MHNAAESIMKHLDERAAEMGVDSAPGPNAPAETMMVGRDALAELVNCIIFSRINHPNRAVIGADGKAESLYAWYDRALAGVGIVLRKAEQTPKTIRGTR